MIFLLLKNAGLNRKKPEVVASKYRNREMPKIQSLQYYVSNLYYLKIIFVLSVALLVNCEAKTKQLSSCSYLIFYPFKTLLCSVLKFQ